MAESLPEGGFGLYVHWPFCEAKCPYCDFNSYVLSEIDQERWARAYARDIARAGAETEGRVLSSIFLGGGTPSLMAEATVRSVIKAARDYWPFAKDIEITLEANPTSVEAGRFEGYREAGINRVSLGVQALEDEDLRALGRRHTSGEALAAIEVARSVFNRVSFDLIYARQAQSLSAWEAELRAALSLGPDHLSLYQLTIEEGTAFGERAARGLLRDLPGEDLSADLFEITQDTCNQAGLSAYEVSNHARSGSEGRHNLLYWTDGDWVGIGPGAHGRLTVDGARIATDTPLEPLAWLHQVEMSGSGQDTRSVLSQSEHRQEYLLMGLRLRDGVSVDRLSELSDGLRALEMSRMVDLGLIEVVDGRLRLTAAGRPLLNAVLREFFEV